MHVQHLVCSITLIFVSRFVCAADHSETEKKEPQPNAVNVVESKLIKQAAPIRVQSLPAGKVEKAIIYLPDKLVWDLASRIKDKQPGIAPNDRSPESYSTHDITPHGATIIAGIAISLAMISFVLLRQRFKRLAWLSGVAGVTALGIAAANYTQANYAPTLEMILKGDHCQIVVVPDGRDVILLVPEK